MRRILPGLLLVIALITPGSALAQAGLHADLAQSLKHVTPTSEATTPGHLPEVADAPVDPRAQVIEQLLARYHAPIQGLGAKFVEVADRDGYDWRLLVSISGIESSFGQAQLGYNLFGWGGGQTRFQSFEDAIDQVSRGLAKGYIARGLTTPETINPVYCPPNRAWSTKVRTFMNQLSA